MELVDILLKILGTTSHIALPTLSINTTFPKNGAAQPMQDYVLPDILIDNKRRICCRWPILSPKEVRF
jgi:hypothetical protein